MSGRSWKVLGLRAPGIELLGDLQFAGNMGWQHFRAPDGTILELSWDRRLTA
jgi:hypothetical protein